MAGGELVLTTGANSGVGLATAIAAARAGFDSVGSEVKDRLARVTFGL